MDIAGAISAANIADDDAGDENKDGPVRAAPPYDDVEGEVTLHPIPGVLRQKGKVKLKPEHPKMKSIAPQRKGLVQRKPLKMPLESPRK